MTMNTRIDTEAIEQHQMYETTLFVNREPELRIIKEKVRQAQAKGIIEDPIINFWGIKGIGKTWILHHLHYLYSYRPDTPTAPLTLPTFALLYSFSGKPEGFLLEQITHALANEMLAQLASSLKTQEQEALLSIRDTNNLEELVKVIQTFSHHIVPLILLDTAEDVRQADWEVLERSLIEPLVSTGRILVVIAGRRQAPRWRRFEVRRRAMEPEKSRLRPFDKQAVNNQIEQRQYQIPVDLLFPYTAGNPHLVDVVAQHIMTWAKGAKGVTLDRRWFEQHQQDLLKILREAEGQFLKNVPPELRSALDAVSTLRFYRVEALRAMLAIRGVVAEQPDGYYLNTLRALDQQTEVVWWERERRAYVTSQVVRQLVNRRQLLDNRENYITRHRQAIAMYWEWVHSYPQASEDFILEIWFHLACLYQADGNIDKLQAETKEALHFAHTRLNSDRFMILPEQLKGDRELLDLLPPDLHDELFEELGQLLNDR